MLSCVLLYYCLREYRYCCTLLVYTRMMVAHSYVAQNHRVFLFDVNEEVTIYRSKLNLRHIFNKFKVVHVNVSIGTSSHIYTPFRIGEFET